MKKLREQPFRTIHDVANRADWLRDRGDGHAGFAELLNPGSTKRVHRRAKKRAPKIRAVDAAPVVALPIELSVPLPSERQRREICVPSREGQAQFRAMVIAAYGQCAVTGCRDEVVLQAAHIIPYVDDRSHVLHNGICLRADIHSLFDRGLISVGANRTIEISKDVTFAEYQALNGRMVMLPRVVDAEQCMVLLAERHRYL